MNARLTSLPLHRPVHREVAPRPLRGLRGVVLLGGSVWMSGLRAAIGRPAVELPVEAAGPAGGGKTIPGKTILDVWCERVTELGEDIARTDLPIRVVMTHGGPLPSAATVMKTQAGPAGEAPRRRNLAIERDAVAFRGTGGVLRDLADGEPDDGYLLVANAAQLVVEPLAPVIRQLAACDADVSFVAHYDGTPSRLMLIRSRCLGALPQVGFVDLMEQGLPLIAAEHSVKAVQRAHAASLPVRTREGYVAALQRYHRAAGAATAGNGMGGNGPAGHGASGAGGEDWRASFALAEERAQVDSSACLHDSVVLAGGRVERGAVVARSVVCPGGVVPRGAVVVDRVIGSAGGGQAGA